MNSNIIPVCIASFFRIKLLAPGTVQFAITIHQDAVGKIEIEPNKTSWTKNGSNSSSSSSNTPAKEGIGKIIYELNGLSLEIPLHSNDCDLRDFPRKGDIVRYDLKTRLGGTRFLRCQKNLQYCSFEIERTPFYVVNGLTSEHWET